MPVILAIGGVFTPASAKHTKNFRLQDSISIGVDRMQRNFEPMRPQIKAWARDNLRMKPRNSSFVAPSSRQNLGCPNTRIESHTVVTSAPSVEGIRAADDVATIEGVHFGLQGTGNHSAVPGDGQGGGILEGVNGA